MHEFRTIISNNGRIVIPAALRRQLHIEGGEELIIRVDNNEMRIFSVKHSLEKARSLVRKYTKNKNLVKQLKTLRQKDANNE